MERIQELRLGAGQVYDEGIRKSFLSGTPVCQLGTFEFRDAVVLGVNVVPGGLTIQVGELNDETAKVHELRAYPYGVVERTGAFDVDGQHTLYHQTKHLRGLF